MSSSPPPHDDALDALVVRLGELPGVPRVLELRAAARKARHLARLGILSAIEETSLAVDLDLATMRIARELDEGLP